MVAFRGDEPVDELRAENGDLSGLAAFVGKHSFRQGIVGAVRNLTPSEEKALKKPNTDLLIIDAGTCITYEVIDARGNYWGGNIAPGMQMRLRALHEFTARLPLVDPEGEVPGMGYSTETAIRSGVLRGMKYEIEGYIKSMRSKFPRLQVFLTGGNRINFDEDIKNLVFTDKYIVPRGLNKILDYNEELRIKN